MQWYVASMLVAMVLPLWFATGANYNTWHARCLAIRLVVIVKTFSFTSGQCMSYMVCSPKAGTRTCKPSHIHMIQLMVVMLHFCNTSGCLHACKWVCHAVRHCHRMHFRFFKPVDSMSHIHGPYSSLSAWPAGLSAVLLCLPVLE